MQANVLIATNGEAQKVDPAEPVHPGRRSPGRPSLLTPAVERMFMNCLKAGNYRSVCAKMCGLSSETVKEWVSRGRGNDPQRPATPAHRRFVKLVEEAEAVVEVIVVGNLVQRSAADHNAALAWLRASPERRERWGPASFEDDEPYPQLPAAARPQLPAGQVQVQHVERQIQVILPPEAVPDTVHKLLEERRRERAEMLAANAQVIEVEPENGRGRVSRLDALRVEPDAERSDDTD